MNVPSDIKDVSSFLALDNGREDVFDHLAALAAKICNTPYSLIGVYLPEKSWFKAVHGLPGAEPAPEPVNFCSYTMRSPGIFQVSDALHDPRFQKNPYVCDTPHIRFYAGMPIAAPEGPVIGTLCVLDSTPRSLTPHQTELLHHLSQIVGSLMDAARVRNKNRMFASLQQNLQSELDAHRYRLELAIGVANLGTWELDSQQQSLWLSAQANTILGRDATCPAHTLTDLMDTIQEEDQPLLSEMIATICETGELCEAQFRVKLPMGGIRWAVMRGGKNSTGTHLTGVISDITERKQQEMEQTWLAWHDPLTGLTNRRHFQDRLTQAIGKADNQATRLALLYLDLDHFKDLNDTLGHDAGDQALITAANRISACVRKADLLARMGGDEFTILIEDIKQTEDAEAIAQKIIHRVSRAFIIDGSRQKLGISIGIAIYPDHLPGDAQSPTEKASMLIRKADAAMYTSKSNGRNNYSFFDGRRPGAPAER